MTLSLIPLLPFIGFLLTASLGRRLSKWASSAIACAAILAAFSISALTTWQLLGKAEDARSVTETVFTWIVSGSFEAPLALRLDPLSALMILVIAGIGSLIHVYSVAYMHDESSDEFARYFSYLNLFAAFMLLLVLGANFLVLFIGWEGVGLCSYLLIGFWYKRQSACDAGKKAFIVNRIGDVAFVLGVVMVFVHFGTIDFQEIARLVSGRDVEMHFGVLSTITLLLFVGATGKSAQIPLYIWLPDAMEGPTPVSALIHAATMVTAGVYMIGRNAALFSHAPETLQIVAVIGAATAFVAGTIGLVQRDIKRVLAYSTVSQLGYMFLAMGVGAYAAGIFHLYTHAFFKALLFLGSGAVIHALAGEQDLRRMGGLRRSLPLTYWTFLVGALAIAGVPGFSGFFSKDEILFRTFTTGHLWLWAIALVTSLLTAVYMFRLVFLAFHGVGKVDGMHETQSGGPSGGTHALHDAPLAMATALVILALGSMLAGYLGLPHALGGANRFDDFLAPSLSAGVASGESGPDTPDVGLELGLMVLSTIVAVGGIGLAAFFFVRNRAAADALATRFSRLYGVLLGKYYVDEVYDEVIVRPIWRLSEAGLWKRVDARWIDGAVNGVGAAVRGAGQLLRQAQSGSVRAYAASLFLGVILILGYYLWR